jgi:outer membrane receptor protein involved in Fe transport
MDRDMGVMALGEVIEGLDYRFAVMNGTWINTTDDNIGKDIIGRVIYEPIEYVTFGAGFVSGNSRTDVEGADDNTKTRYGADFEIRYKDFLAQGEYIYGKDVGAYTEGGGCEGDPVIKEGSIKRDGYFITLLYTTEWNLEPVLRYERYNADKDVEDDVWHAWTFGLNYFLNDWTRLQANYIRRIEDFVPALENDELVIQMQVVFE